VVGVVRSAASFPMTLPLRLEYDSRTNSFPVSPHSNRSSMSSPPGSLEFLPRRICPTGSADMLAAALVRL